FTKYNSDGTMTFYPLYWMKTGLLSQKHKASFEDFLKDKASDTIYLWSDPDLILAHFRSWKKQGYWNLLKDKHILTMSWEDLAQRAVDEEPQETPMNEDNQNMLMGSQLSALLIWGFAIPKNAPDKALSLSMVEAMTKTSVQEGILLETPFSTALTPVGAKSF